MLQRLGRLQNITREPHSKLCAGSKKKVGHVCFFTWFLINLGW